MMQVDGNVAGDDGNGNGWNGGNSLAFESIAEAAATAETYAHAAMNFAAVGDARGLAYSLRCAAAALRTASEMAETLRPNREGRRAC